MKIRSDSPFAKLTDEEKMWILDYAQVATLEKVTDNLLLNYGIDTSDSAVQRFVARLRTERMVQDAKDRNSDLEELAAAGKNATSREAALELARQKLLNVVEKSVDEEKLAEVVKTLSEEKAREHESAMRERAMKVAEENAKLGWRKLELQEARSALRLLPAILQVVTGGDGTAEERLAKVWELLMSGGGKLLLMEGADRNATGSGGC